MSLIWTIARKELRSFFNSAVALIFLLTFLCASLFILFWYERFFARGIADVRPMFEWFPLLLIFLVAALTMRMWSEEQKLGTLEVLMTLPVRTHQLILGKFTAGMVLIGLALVLTLGVPITVSLMGDLDWGPVIGGYLAALLLGGTYLAVGLCVSSLTDNQVIALVFTVLAGVILYLPGAEALTALVDYDTAESLRKLGTGSRFESIARGVLDLRDVVYYAGLIALFIALNNLIIEAKRWSRGSRTAGQRRTALLAVALTAGNVLALNLWLAPVHAARADLTEYGDHSLSPVTEKIVGGLDEPLLIRAYISRKVHPLVQPLVPQIRDVLREYQHAGGGRVRVEFVDPLGNEELEREAERDFGVGTVTFKFEDRRESAFVNAYFSILVKYGDQYEVLDILGLLDVERRGVDDVDVRLGNLEYELTRAIKKAAQGFNSVDRLLARLPTNVEVTSFLSPKNLPSTAAELPAMLETVIGELKEKAGDKLTYQQKEPTTEKEQLELYRKYGLQPFSSLLGDTRIYMHLMIEVAGSIEIIALPEEPTEARLRELVLASLRRRAPGYQKTIGIWVPRPRMLPPANPQGQPRQRPPAQSFRELADAIGDNHELRAVDLSSGAVPAEIDVLLLAGPDGLSEAEAYAVDQFVMRGGTTIILAGRYRLAADRRVRVEPVTTGLEKVLESYGVDLADKLVMDQQSETFAVPEVRSVRGRDVERLREIPYPYFVWVRDDGMPDAGVIASRLSNAVVMYGSPVNAVAPAEPTGDGADDYQPPARKVLLRSSDDSWLSTERNVQPDFTTYPDTGFAGPESSEQVQKGPFDLAVALTGSFASAFSDGAPKSIAGDDDAADRTLTRSPPGTRLVVVGSSVMASDEGNMLAQLMGTKRHLNNQTLLLNLIDWAVEDDDLLSIRASGSQIRILDIDEDDETSWEWINYGLAIFGLGMVVGIGFIRRRTVEEMALLPRGDGDDTGEEE